MAKLTRKTQKIFGNNADSDQITAFGTAKTSNPVYTTDIDQIQSDTYLQGWTPSLMSDLAPYLQDSNALWFAITRQLAYIYQEGVAEWDANTEYNKGSIVKSVVGDSLVYYMSKTNGNIGNAITDTNYWASYSFASINSAINNALSVANSKITFSQASNGIMPNWGAGYQIYTGWTAPTNGWIRSYMYFHKENNQVYISGQAVGGDIMTWQSDYSDWYIVDMAPISAGNSVTWEQRANNTVYFFPCKGV